MRTHGKPATYTQGGCRCVECTAAATAYNRVYRQRRHERTQENGGVAPAAVHNAATYAMWGCRCEQCTTANREASREFARRRREGSS